MVPIVCVYLLELPSCLLERLCHFAFLPTMYEGVAFCSYWYLVLSFLFCHSSKYRNELIMVSFVLT